MIREAVGKHYIGMNKEFRFRGEEPGRLENLSDAAFALTIALLLISTSAPVNFEQIKRFVWELPPFCACIILIVLIWHEHFVFYYRYGLRNTKTIVLNTLFLIIVLFYVYPLKFLCKLLILFPIAYIFNEQSILTELAGMIKAEDVSHFMIIYGLGAACIFYVLTLMYRYALKNAPLLILTGIEEFDTRRSMVSNFIMGSIPLLSAILAYIFKNYQFGGMISGLTYFLYTPVMFLYNIKMDRRRTKLLADTSEQSL